MSSSVKVRGRACHSGCGLARWPPNAQLKETFLELHPGSAASAIPFQGAESGSRESGLGLWHIARRHPMAYAASKATKGAAPAATVLTIITKTIDDVSMASVSA